MKYLFCKLKSKTATAISKTHGMLSSNCGEGYIDTAIKILLAVVIGRPAASRALRTVRRNGAPDIDPAHQGNVQLWRLTTPFKRCFFLSCL